METRSIIKNRHDLKMDVIANTVDNAAGTAIIHHGYVGSTKSPTIQLMRETFNELGFNTVTPNTTHNYNDSDGDYRQMTLAGHAEDLIDCISHTVNSTVFRAPLIIAGHSAGGYSALFASSVLSGTQYAPILTIASAPLISGQRYMEGWREVISNEGISPDSFMEKWENQGFIICGSDSGPDQLELHWSVMKDWCLHDLTDSKTCLKNPAILISGDIDPFIRRSDIADYLQSTTNPNIEARFIPNADHCYTDQEDVFAECLRSSVGYYLPKAKL